MSAALVAKILAERDVQYAVVGGIAVIARGHLRSTRDFDFLTTNTSALSRDVWAALEPSANVDVRRGDFDDPLRGVVRIRFPDADPVDVVVAKYKWQQEVIARAERIDIGGLVVPVPRTPDLILLKLFAAGPIDVADIHALLNVGERSQIVADVDGHIADLPADAQNLWATLRNA